VGDRVGAKLRYRTDYLRGPSPDVRHRSYLGAFRATSSPLSDSQDVLPEICDQNSKKSRIPRSCCTTVDKPLK
jgi:hypothetical protein